MKVATKTFVKPGISQNWPLLDWNSDFGKKRATFYFFIFFLGQHPKESLMFGATRASLDKHSPPPPSPSETIPATREAGKKLAEKCKTHYFPPPKYGAKQLCGLKPMWITGTTPCCTHSGKTGKKKRMKKNKRIPINCNGGKKGVWGKMGLISQGSRDDGFGKKKKSGHR